MSQSKGQYHGSDHHLGKKTARRVEISRQFVCGCGKCYLSYPALYTHIKTKHNGNQQEGTQRTIFIPYSKVHEEMSLSQNFVSEAERYVNPENLMVISQIQEGGKGFTEKEKRIVKYLIGKQIWDYYSFLSQQSLININLDRKSPLDLVIIVYLLGVGQYVSYSLMKHYNVFACLFRNCFYHHAQQIAELCFKRETKEIDTTECRMGPVITDFFVRFYVPNTIKDKEQLNLYQLITNDFCQWMKFHQLTGVQITMQSKYQLKNKKFFQIVANCKKVQQKKGNSKKKSGKKIDDQRSQNKNKDQEEVYMPKTKPKKRNPNKNLKNSKTQVKNAVKAGQVKKQKNEGMKDDKKVSNSQKSQQNKNQNKKIAEQNQGNQQQKMLQNQMMEDYNKNQEQINWQKDKKKEDNQDNDKYAEQQAQEMRDEMEKNQCLEDLLNK